MRCLALAERLRNDGAEVVFISRKLPGNLCDRVADRGFNVLCLPVPPLSGHVVQSDNDSTTGRAQYAEWLGVSQETDAAQTAECLTRLDMRPDWLVVDHYGIDETWERHLRSRVSHILVIDDLADRKHDCDILLDPTLWRSADDYAALVSAECVLLLGPYYALLRPDFTTQRECTLSQRTQRVGIERILVSLGGTDPHNVTAKALAGIASSGLQAEVDVVLNSSAPYLNELRRISTEPSPAISIHVDTPHMADLMARADLAIGAAGNTSWERCCVGLPSVMLILANNQRAIAERLGRHGAALVLGWYDTVSAGDIANALLDLSHNHRLRDMVRKTSQICDGRGVARVSAELLPPLLAKDGHPVRLRPAEMGDAAMVYAWQSQDETRRFARQPQKPGWDEHQVWFESRFNQPGCIMNIILHGKDPVGVLRLDKKGDSGAYEISILVAPEKHRHGIGYAALGLARRLLPDGELVAEVLPGNSASHALFRRAGYRERAGMYVSMPAVGAQSVRL